MTGGHQGQQLVGDVPIRDRLTVVVAGLHQQREHVAALFEGRIGPCIGALRLCGTLVGFGFVGAPGILSKLLMFANIFIGARLRGRRGEFYGITALYRKDPKPFREDLPKIFALLAEKKIDPLISRSFALLEARQAVELLASGSVEGKIVLTAN